MNDRPLWRCDACGREFANRNQTHACGRHDLDSHFAGKDPAIRELFDRVVDAVRACGPVKVLPEKTRIAFQVRMSFAQVTPRRRFLDGHVVLARRLEHPRFRSIQTISARNHVHVFRLTRPDEIDGDFRAWLAEAYRVGEQRHLVREEAPSARGAAVARRTATRGKGRSGAVGDAKTGPGASKAVLPLRIRVLDPPSGVSFALQRGRDELVPPAAGTPEELAFELDVLVSGSRDEPPRLTGPFAQGPPASRFVYVCSGTLAGQSDSCWTRRAKVPLGSIGWEDVDAVLRRAGEPRVLEAAIRGTAGDGGPACASVPLARAWRARPP